MVSVTSPAEHTTFGELLRRCRIAAALSQEVLAERAGLSIDAIRALERGRRSSPRPETLARLAAALDLSPEGGFLAPATVPAPPAKVTATRPMTSTLPLPPTALIGREDEVATIQRLLRRDAVRLLTLIGPGGVGKTRLALAAARAMQEEYPDGVVFVDLSALRDPAQVVATIAQALDVRDIGKQTLNDLLRRYLASRQLLLLLDNFEHVLDAATQVADLLATCPRLAVLLTSRIPLRIMAERRFPVQPLVTPGRSDVAVEELSHYGSVQLFVNRAQAVQPDFQLDALNAVVVAEICRRLDGLPLAIELAAAWVLMLPSRTLLDRLERRLAILTRGSRDLPPRQQTLRATIDWSYDLLFEHDRVLFRRIAVFSCGCIPDAVETVCNPDGILATLDGMSRLLEHSLLRREAVSNATPASDPRFALLETIREYALERLAESGEEEHMRRNHALCYLTLAEAAEPEVYGPAHSAWIARLEREHDNLRAALAWSWQQGEHDIALRLAGALWRFWHVRGYLTEGRGWFQRLLTAGGTGRGAGSAAARIKALLGAGWLAHYQYDFAEATTLFEESIALRRAQGQEGNLTEVLVTHAVEARNAGDYRRATSLLEECVNRLRAEGDRKAISQGGLGIALARLAMMHSERGDYAQATTLWEECLTLHHELADREGVAISLLGLSDVARDQGDSARVRELCEQCLAGFRELGEQWAIGFALNNLALAAYQDGDLATAGALAEKSVDVFRGLQTGASIAEALTTLGLVAGAQADAARAEAALVEALGLAEAGAPRWVVAAGLEALAALAVQQGVVTRAARLLGAAAALRAAMDVPLPAARRGDHDRMVAVARTSLGEAAYASAWQAGQALSFRQAVEEAVRPPLP